jgi:hypothetical protein
VTLDDVGLFVAKGHVIACHQWDAILDDQFGEDRVGLCILYFLNNISARMTIWKWLFLQTILDGYPLKSFSYHTMKAIYLTLMKRE